MDEGHQKFFDIFNKWEEALRAGDDENAIKGALNELIDFSRAHFREEERLMIDSGYAGYESHSKEHKNFLDKVLQFSNDHASGDDMVGINISSFMRNWIQNHIKGVDMEAVDIFKRNPPE